jgi:hypothetical protein
VHNRSGEFRKVGQNPFRYSANEVYYAIYKIAGKKIWKSLETTDANWPNDGSKQSWARTAG